MDAVEAADAVEDDVGDAFAYMYPHDSDPDESEEEEMDEEEEQMDEQALFAALSAWLADSEVSPAAFYAFVQSDHDEVDVRDVLPGAPPPVQAAALRYQAFRRDSTRERTC